MAKKKPFLEAAKICGYVILCLLAGFIGSLFTTTGPGTWYAQLVKPSFNPPNWIFAPVWTTLYIMIGISLYLAIKHRVDLKAKMLFALQLILNTLWTIFFFGLENISLAIIDIIFLWIAILLMILIFYKKSKPAAYLLVPYLLWVSFATLLTISIYLLN